VGDNTKIRSPLLPDRRAQNDFFVCDIFDAALKGDMASMEHPIFSIATRPDTNIRRYENGDTFVEVTPSVKGLATVHDRDVLIFCISQIIAALNEERPISSTVRFKAFDLLASTNRGTDGRGYEQLRAALERLSGTRIVTNITTDDVEIFDGFGLIDRFRIVRETREGRMQEVEITLSDWVFNAIRGREVLTIHRDYFRLRRPLERRIYELARKHCGRQASWSISLELLQLKCGSHSTLKEFRRAIGAIAEQDREHEHIPDYSIELTEVDQVMFRSRGTVPGAALSLGKIIDVPPLDPEIYEAARRVAPGWDVYVLEREWREWISEPPRSPDAAFLGFCRKWASKRGKPN